MEFEKDYKAETDYKAEISANIEAPPPPYTSIIGPQILDVYYRHWHCNVIIADSAGQELFSSQGNGLCNTRLEILNRNRQVIGSSKCSNLTSKINVEISNASGVSRAFEIHNSASILGGSPKYKSPAFGGNEMAWKNKAMSTKIIYELIDGHGKSFAKFQSDPRTKIGKLEIREVTGEDMINEVAVTLLTLLQRKLRNIEISTLVAVT